MVWEETFILINHMAMKKLQEKFTQVANNAKVLVPMTLIALTSVFSSWCGTSPAQSREGNERKIMEYQKEDLNSNFILVGNGIYYYSGKWSDIEGEFVSWEETAVALDQFRTHHPALKIVDVIKDMAHANHQYDGMTVITETQADTVQQ